MRFWLAISAPLSLIPLLCLAAAPPWLGQTSKSSAPKPHQAARTQGAPAVRTQSPPVQAAVWAFFASNCAGCHNAKAKAGNLDLQSLRTADSVTRSRETWESILRKIRTGEMPPKGSPRPDPAQVKATTGRIEAAFEQADRLAAPDPGRVTARRLNRAEYNNTIRDLLGVDFRPADDFPQDDSGYGFDNIGDVLSLSTSQMEKYVAAAEKIARTAVFGPDSLTPTLAHYERSSRKLVPSTTVPAAYDATGLSLPNAVSATHRFPVDGEYLFRFNLNGVRPLGSEPMHLGLWIDGKQVQAMDIDTVGAAAFFPDRQDFSGKSRECRLRVTAGDHWVAATIERMYEGLPVDYGGPKPSLKHVAPPEFKPPPGLPPERLALFKQRFEARRKERAPTNDARVSALEIGGPYAQAKGASEASLRRVFTCGHLHGGHNASCTGKIVADLARRAFRRPVTPQEIERLAGLVSMARKQGGTYEEGISLALEGILVSAHFLFRIERDPQAAGAHAADTAHPLSQHELASRLSYFLWSSMPDDTLRDCADRQILRKPGVLAEQVRRMLKDPKSRALAENFGGQWLQFRALELVKPNKDRFPDFDDYLRMSMRQETEMFFESIVRDDRSILDFLDAKYTYLNGRLAGFYGIPNVEGPAFRRVDLTGTARGGVLTQASVLTVTSYATRTSPVLRGKWILENILNAPPPPPPPDVPNLDVTSVGASASLRQQLEQHRKNAICASCHARMDPLGFGLENFDGVGAWRKIEGTIPIDASGSLPDGRTFSGPDGLKGILEADRGAFAQCLTEKLMTYALGRGLERYDRPAVTNITQRVAADQYRFSSLVQAIVESRPFQMRRGDRVQ